jgi:hypothetical protein
MQQEGVTPLPLKNRSIFGAQGGGENDASSFAKFGATSRPTGLKLKCSFFI